MKAQDYKNLNKLTINQKINFKNFAYLCLTWHQYEQLINLNKLVLAPYYFDLLKIQEQKVKEAETFKAIFGKSRYEYENNI
jgi:hypothetical protein